MDKLDRAITVILRDGLDGAIPHFNGRCGDRADVCAYCYAIKVRREYREAAMTDHDGDAGLPAHYGRNGETAIEYGVRCAAHERERIRRIIEARRGISAKLLEESRPGSREHSTGVYLVDLCDDLLAEVEVPDE